MIFPRAGAIQTTVVSAPSRRSGSAMIWRAGRWNGRVDVGFVWLSWSWLPKSVVKFIVLLIMEATRSQHLSAHYTSLRSRSSQTRSADSEPNTRLLEWHQPAQRSSSPNWCVCTLCAFVCSLDTLSLKVHGVQRKVHQVSELGAAGGQGTRQVGQVLFFRAEGARLSGGHQSWCTAAERRALWRLVSSSWNL